MTMAVASRLRLWHRRRLRQQCTACQSRMTSSEDHSQPPPLVRLDSARLVYPEESSTCQEGKSPLPTRPLSLSIHPPNADLGSGHAVLGRNASGKSLLHLALAHGTSVSGPDFSHVASGDIRFPDDPNEKYKSRYPVSSVSFDSHHRLLQSGGTGYAALTPLGGRLSKAAEFLVVRFGLYPLLGRDISTLSTGEIRKVLLVRALSTRPKLLLLDNAFDGLDVPSRESLSDLVSKMLRGFRTDILVQGVDARNAARTQVVMSTHRSEEIVDEIGTISWLGRGTESNEIVTEKRMGRSGARLMRAVHDDWGYGDAASSIGDEEEAEQNVQDLMKKANTKAAHQTADRPTWGGAISGAWDDPDLPSLEDIATLMDRDAKTSKPKTFEPPVQTENMRLAKGEHLLLSDLTWSVDQGERWLIAGGNGQGKSTLSRVLVEGSNDIDEGSLSVSVDDSEIGWVSTELHMTLTSSSCSTRDVLMGLDAKGNNAFVEPSSSYIAEIVSSWLRIDDTLLSRPFSHLSQGEQKMILIARAIASRPRLLIVDEPMQGLDWHNRRRALGLIERVCQATDTSMVYITHHLEELLPCVTHVLHLREGRAVYQGDIHSYDPEQY